MRDAAKAGGSLARLAPEGVAARDPSGRGTGSEVPRNGKGSANGLNDLTQMRIGNHLRSLYDSILQQPVPDRFRDLIDRLDSEQPKTP